MKNSLAYFENLLQIPYPLPKLDLLAVPRFEAGGEENFGLVRSTGNIMSIRLTESLAVSPDHHSRSRWPDTPRGILQTSHSSR